MQCPNHFKISLALVDDRNNVQKLDIYYELVFFFFPSESSITMLFMHYGCRSQLLAVLVVEFNHHLSDDH